MNVHAEVGLGKGMQERACVSGLNTRLSTLVVRFMRLFSGALAAAGSGRPRPSLVGFRLRMHAHSSEAITLSSETDKANAHMC